MNNFKKHYVSPEANVIIVDEDVIMTSEAETGEGPSDPVEFPEMPI